MKTSERRCAIVFGTRPEIIKLAPLIKLLGERAFLIHTGQHFDSVLSADILADLDLGREALNLGVGGSTRASQIGNGIAALESALSDVDGVIVQGDTNSALAGAIAANALEIPLFHVEAGLRSFDRRMPEEHNRVVVDHLADVCWAPTNVNVANLAEEGIDGDAVIQTGNTIVEALAAVMPGDERATATLERFGVERRGYVLVTLHRPENVDDVDRLAKILEILGQLPMPVVFPMHPRTRSTMERAGIEPFLPPIEVVDPVAYRHFLSLLGNAALAISDSGGIQEEVSILKVPLVVLRRSTERPEVLGTFASLTSDVGEMLQLSLGILDRGASLFGELSTIPTPYGDGKASHRMLQSVVSHLDG